MYRGWENDKSAAMRGRSREKRRRERREKGERFGKQVVDESFFIERLFVFTCGYF